MLIYRFIDYKIFCVHNSILLLKSHCTAKGFHMVATFFSPVFHGCHEDKLTSSLVTKKEEKGITVLLQTNEFIPGIEQNMFFFFFFILHTLYLRTEFGVIMLCGFLRIYSTLVNYYAK